MHRTERLFALMDVLRRHRRPVTAAQPAVDPDSGTLSPVGYAPTQGKAPCHFRMAPTGKLLLVANQGSSNIVAFHVDEATGALRPTGRVTEVPEPTCVGIAASPGP
ncbi:beta-propeller fold lactonase family protein [Sorangium sp. So ce367]|uniref:lactonase family protein n=1 Tax=Sorangium sp. So ce367 TaxID=3133305 RepID=UPI003F5EF379